MSNAATKPVDEGGASFAGVMLIVLGCFNLVNGFSLLNKAEWFEEKFIASNADTWGWIVIVFAVLQLVAGIKLVTSGGGGTLAVVLASIGMVMWFMLLFSFPFAALIGTAINFSIIASVLSRPVR